MKKMQNEWQNEVQKSTYKGFFAFAATLVGVAVICGFAGTFKNASASSDSRDIDYYLENSANSTYRYGSGSGISGGSGTSSGSGKTSGSSQKSSTSKTTKKKTTASQSKGSAKRYTTKKRSSKQKAYDDFMDDALEDYLSCVDSYEEYEEAEEFFDEGWLTPDERAELDRLMDAYED